MKSFRVDILGSGTPGATIRLFGPDGLIGRRPISEGDADRFAASIQQKYQVHAPNLRAIGQELFEWLDNSGDRWLTTAVEGANALSLHLDLGGNLTDLPWELLCDQTAYWCGLPGRLFTPVRNAARREAESLACANRPLRILFMACSPRDVEPVLEFEKEERFILDATKSQTIELVVEESGSLEGLRQRLEWGGPGYFDVIHLTGHGDVIDGVPRMLAEDDLGRRKDATAHDISEAFEGTWPRLIFLSGCKTGMPAGDATMTSLAQSLVASGAPAVLGWALPVGDEAASGLAAELYHRLGIGRRLDEGVAASRAKLYEEKSAYWHMLRLYADASPLDPVVTVPSSPDRKRLATPSATHEFLDAGAQSQVCSRQKFVGRRRLIQDGLSRLRSSRDDEYYSAGLLLYGMGGLGKSSLAARLCERMLGWRRFVWVGPLDEAEFLRVFGERIDDPDALALLNDDRLPLLTRLGKLLDGYFLENPTLFVFDDFEQNADTRNHEPRLDADGRLLVRPEPLKFLSTLLRVVREKNSACRVLVTCRYDLPGLPELHRVSLAGFKRADLDKKLSLLNAFRRKKDRDDPLRKRAVALAGGNPRLLERLDKVLCDEQTDAQAIVEAMERVADQFREDVLLRGLTDQQDPESRRLLARLSVFELPVEAPIAEAVASGIPIETHVDRAVAVGLVERIEAPGTEPHYLVAPVLAPLLTGELTKTQWQESVRTAATCLYETWWKAADNRILERGLEIHRLAVRAGDLSIAATVGNALAMTMIHRNRYREALVLCKATRQVGDDFRILHSQGRAELVLGHTERARQHYEAALQACPAVDDSDRQTKRERAALLHNTAELESLTGDVARAMELWQESVDIEESIGNLGGKAATLHNMAGVIAQQGDVARAMELWQESLGLKDKIGDVKGKAATLHQMAGVIAQQGDVARAMELWQESLGLKDKIGDVKGKAATLHQMAGVIAQQGDVARAMELWQESLGLMDKIGDVKGKAATLSNMAGVIAQQGDVDRAMELWQESLGLKDKIGDVQGKAAMLHNMAGVIAQQGDVARAMELWQESLGLLDKIGDVQGKAATLSNMAGVIAQQGDVARAMELWQESLGLKDKIGDVKGKAATLSNMAGVIAQQGDVARAMELWQESLGLDDKIGDVKGKAATLHQMAGVIAQQGDVARAMELWQESLGLKDKIGDVKGKAATLHQMAGVIAQQGDVARAMELWQESVDIEESIGNLGGKAATLSNMAGVIAQQGDVARAMELWQESLGLMDKIGDVKGKATTLHNMAGVIAQQGDVARAMELWQESLGLKDKIGDVKGKAATLANMAWAAGQQDDSKRELELNLQAAGALASAGAFADLVTVLGNLGASDRADAVKYLAQSVWLLLRVQKSVQESVTTTAALLQKVEPTSDAGPLVAAAAMYFAHTRGEKDPNRAEMQQLATGMAAACATARDIGPEQLQAWVQAEMLDPADWLPKLEACLTELGGADEDWLFDRAQLPKLSAGE